MTEALHCFTNGSDTVIAGDIDDAWAVWCADTGERRSDYGGTVWLQLGDNEVIGLCVDENYEPVEHDGGELLELTTAEWAAKLGRCILCTTEY
jgi:hypothetical protein